MGAIMNKKLQVFVSSTYTDLIEERQAAVEAILDAGHIPAGMELFKAGNETQLKTIYRWIDESDVYMLILGGRYGSIETESGKSYTELEYCYAIKKKIPVFAVVLKESWLTQKAAQLGLANILEQTEPSKYQLFKKFVMSKVIRPVEDCKDIKIVIHSTLNEFINKYELAGWSRNTPENDTVQLLKDNNTLIKDNLALNKQIQKLKEQINSKNREQFGDYSFKELLIIFKERKFEIPQKLIDSDKNVFVDAGSLFIDNYNTFCVGIKNDSKMSDISKFLFYKVCPYFISFGLLEKVKLAGTTAQRIQTTKLASSFYALIESKNTPSLK